METLFFFLSVLKSSNSAEAERVGYGFTLPKEVVPNVPRNGLFVVSRKIPSTGILINRMTETMGV